MSLDHHLLWHDEEDPVRKQEIAFESYADNIGLPLPSGPEPESALDNKPPSAFDPENIATATLITLARIYDTQVMILKLMDENEAVWLVDLHAQGGFLTPPPSFDEEAL